MALNLKCELVHRSPLRGKTVSGIAQGRLPSTSLSTPWLPTFAGLALGVRLSSNHRFSDKLHVVVADSEHDLQVACDVVAGVVLTKSAAMVFGPTRVVPSCSVTLAGVLPLPHVSEYPYLGVTLTSSLTWVLHIRKLITNRLLAQCVSWCRSEHLPLVFASHLFHICVLKSVSWNAKFVLWVSLCCAAPGWSDATLGHLGWPRGSPISAVHIESGQPDAKRLITSRLLPLFGRISSMPTGDCSPIPAPLSRGTASSPCSLIASQSSAHFSGDCRSELLLACVPVVPLDECENGLLSKLSLHLIGRSVTDC